MIVREREREVNLQKCVQRWERKNKSLRMLVRKRERERESANTRVWKRDSEEELMHLCVNSWRMNGKRVRVRQIFEPRVSDESLSVFCVRERKCFCVREKCVKLYSLSLLSKNLLSHYFNTLSPENTNLVRGSTYHWMTDLLFIFWI